MADIISQLKQELSPSELALVLFHAERSAIIVNPFMPSMVERDRPEAVTNPGEKKSPLITLGDAFRQERWMVILGDPGSGKPHWHAGLRSNWLLLSVMTRSPLLFLPIKLIQR